MSLWLENKYTSSQSCTSMSIVILAHCVAQWDEFISGLHYYAVQYFEHDPYPHFAVFQRDELVLV